MQTEMPRGLTVATTTTQTTLTMTDIERRIIAAQGYVELGLFAEAREELSALPESVLERTDVIEITVLLSHGRASLGGGAGARPAALRGGAGGARRIHPRGLLPA